ncbi:MULTISPECIES: H(+)/Cl(-) exchange transporter ClcA [Legionella]|uniref:H(+)/Cl(-) exchange transporter ClcA n=1 Tax=Legionella resiliens TaxID=2905958 RepID=A0ABS8X1W0_9GAMM|nr:MULTISPECIES: H(+)/Cl(-) exchange transporter ClcA [unclassified Legionella]MCE0722463.1 H(+)/Cl(-) exchange transporter ClcA [Legionella sp. 9fVS26]MCE3531617.1 H(+)/Cl(-) exchange transporter ClcA [Legionella sp. 8cVS16]QLZ67637.1 H(+)/Cl(-) exchange transporter ClcA [Legionella sp. PC1000]
MRDKILKLYVLSTLLGILTGTVGSLLQLAIHWLNNVLISWFNFAGSKGYNIGVISALTTMVMVFIAWALVKWVATEASGSGVQEIEGTLLHERPILWRRLLPVKFIGGVMSIGSKMVLGREGPTIQIGGNLGEMLGEIFFLNRKRRDSLIAAGAAAGLATAFNAPLAGVLFVLEEMRNEFNFSFTNFKMVAICCVFATIMLHIIIGPQPDIKMVVFTPPSLQSLWLFFAFGIVVGIVGLCFNKFLMKLLYSLDKLKPWMKDIYVLIIGLTVGYLAYKQPGVVGGGYHIIEQALIAYPDFSVLIMLLIIRFIMTLLCYGTGVPGGIFAPMLALGTILGLAASHILQAISSDINIHPGMLAVAGMGALFAASVRAPITGIILVVEMTQNYLLILPLMITCLTSTTVVQFAKNAPIYTQLLRRTLKKEACS